MFLILKWIKEGRRRKRKRKIVKNVERIEEEISIIYKDFKSMKAVINQDIEKIKFVSSV